MNTTPKCPYCGAEMFYYERNVKGYRFMGYYFCRECRSRAPRIDNIGIDACDMKDTAKAAALQRYVEPANGCCWCIADGVINKVYIRTDDSEYTFIDARFCPKCGRDLEDAE